MISHNVLQCELVAPFTTLANSQPLLAKPVLCVSQVIAT